MQLKKNPRDERFGDLPDEYEQADESRPVPEFEDSPAPVSRPRRDSDHDRDDLALASAPHVESVLDASSSFDGRYEAGQDLRVLGSISGEIVCRGMLTVERDAVARAKIETRDAQLRGRLEGDIICTGRLIIASTATVSGTIKAAALVVEEGASISGTVETAPAATPAPIARIAPEPPPARHEPEPADTAAPAAVAEKEAPAAAGETPAPRTSNGSSRWTKAREVPSFALVSSDEQRNTVDRN